MALKNLLSAGTAAAGRRSVVALVALVGLSLSGADLSHAQSADQLQELKSEIQTLKENQQAILNDLAAIKQLLQQRVAARPPSTGPGEPFDLATGGAPSLGRPDAPVTLVEFTDFQCPFCRRHSLGTKQQLVEDYVDAGKLRYVQREFPIESLHPQAFKAAEAALCAGDQGQYWEIGARFFEDQTKLQPSDLLDHAEALGLDMASFKECVESGKYAPRVRADLRAGQAAGVTGTPSFFLGVTDPDSPDELKVTKMIRGAQPYAAFQQTIEELIAEAGKGS